MGPDGRAAFAEALLVGVSPGAALAQDRSSPIEHVIVIVGENHTFDNIFGGYIPRPGQTVSNLLSQDIIDDVGKPGPNFSLARERISKGDPKGLYAINCVHAKYRCQCFSNLEVSVARCFGSGGGRARSPRRSAASDRRPMHRSSQRHPFPLPSERQLARLAAPLSRL